MCEVSTESRTHILFHLQVRNESKPNNKLRASEGSVDGEHQPSSLSSSIPEARVTSTPNLKGSRLLWNQEGGRGTLDKGILGSDEPRDLQAVCAPGFIDCVNG